MAQTDPFKRYAEKQGNASRRTDLRRKVIAHCDETTGYIVIEYWHAGKVLEAKRYDPSTFAQMGTLAFTVGAHVTP